MDDPGDRAFVKGYVYVRLQNCPEILWIKTYGTTDYHGPTQIFTAHVVRDRGARRVRREKLQGHPSGFKFWTVFRLLKSTPDQTSLYWLYATNDLSPWDSPFPAGWTCRQVSRWTREEHRGGDDQPHFDWLTLKDIPAVRISESVSGLWLTESESRTGWPNEFQDLVVGLKEAGYAGNLWIIKLILFKRHLICYKKTWWARDHRSKYQAYVLCLGR